MSPRDSSKPKPKRRSSRAPKLRDSLERATHLEGGQVQRLGSAGTSVTFEIVDAPRSSVTLLLDRQPPAVADAKEPAEITIEMDSKLAASFAKGELSLPSLILSGDVSYSGPVRKYLSFDPILRSLLAKVNAPEA